MQHKMSIDRAKNYLISRGIDTKRIVEFDTSSATVDLAAAAIGCDPAHIAKSISFNTPNGAILVVTAGDTKIDNAKYKQQFGCKAKMLTPDETIELIGHSIGGVCPFGINKDVIVYLDRSLCRFESVYPACGSSNSAISLSLNELEELSNYKEWIDVCKPK